MAQLIQMRQRIKAIETIKKITHAMQLISMSMHSRLRAKAPLLETYQNEVSILFGKVRFAAPHWQSPIMHPEGPPDSNPLVILVGSQKGLCGNFNSALFRMFGQNFTEEQLKKSTLVAVGKHAVNYMEKLDTGTIIKTFPELSSARLNMVSGRIVELISTATKPYTSVTVVANAMKSFFVQEPRLNQIIPLVHDSKLDSQMLPKEPYDWEQNPNEILDDLALQYLTSKIYFLLFQSILAEQASRFISMDNATRNAKTLLEETQLKYNKLRQAKITRELTELSASFQLS